MELIIGKTAYKTNEYLFTGKNSSEMIAQSNIKHLSNTYKNITLNDLNFFTDNSDSTYTLIKEFEKEIKRPGVIIIEEKESNDKTLFLRDDLFFKLNNDMKKDPVLDYATYVKIENTPQPSLYKKVDNANNHTPKMKI
jgi:hypothetical protein